MSDLEKLFANAENEMNKNPEFRRQLNNAAGLHTEDIVINGEEMDPNQKVTVLLKQEIDLQTIFSEIAKIENETSGSEDDVLSTEQIVEIVKSLDEGDIKKMTRQHYILNHPRYRHVPYIIALKNILDGKPQNFNVL